MKAWLEIKGTLEDKKGVRDFELVISGPEIDAATPFHDSFCRISCPALGIQGFDVYGVSGDQARDLSLRYVRSRLQGGVVRDRTGAVVSV